MTIYDHIIRLVLELQLMPQGMCINTVNMLFNKLGDKRALCVVQNVMENVAPMSCFSTIPLEPRHHIQGLADPPSSFINPFLFCKYL